MRTRKPPLTLQVATERGCPACAGVTPHLRRLAKRLDGALAVEKLPAERPAPGWRPRYIPNMRLVAPDGHVLAKRSGYATASELTEWVAKAVAREARRRGKG